MAYYHPDSVARVRLIKSLQKQRFYPLAVIKHLLEQGDPGFSEIELYDAIHKVEHTASYRPLSLSAVMRQTGLTRAQIGKLEEAGIVAPFESEGKRMFRDSDCRVMRLIKRRQEARLPFEQTLCAFTAYERALNKAVEEDIDSVIADALVPESPSTDEIVHMIRVSDESLDEFVSLRRYELNRVYGSRHIEDVAQFSERLGRFLAALQRALPDDGRRMYADTLRGKPPAGSGGAVQALRAYASVIHLSEVGLAGSVAACSKAHRFFVSLDASAAPESERALLLALRLGWLYLAPDVLRCKPFAEAAAAELKQLVVSGEYVSFPAQVEEALKGVSPHEH
jgi:DNA-binding transcriptional MerR regulator